MASFERDSFNLPKQDPLRTFQERLMKKDDVSPEYVLEEMNFMLTTVHSLMVSFLCAMRQTGMEDFTAQFTDMLEAAHESLKTKGAPEGALRTSAEGAAYFKALLTHTLPAMASMAQKLHPQHDYSTRTKASLALVNLRLLVRGLTFQAMMPVPRSQLMALTDEVPQDLRDTIMSNLKALLAGDANKVMERHEAIIGATVRATMMEHVRGLKARTGG